MLGGYDVEPEVQKIKSHITALDAVECGRSNKHIHKWIISNEAVDVAVEAEADRQGLHDNELRGEELLKARLWKVLLRIWAIEKDVRLSD